MYRYVAIVPNVPAANEAKTIPPLSRDLQSEETKWRCILHTPRMMIYGRSDYNGNRGAYYLPNHRGVVIGTLFVRDRHRDCESGALARDFSDGDTERIRASSGRHLFEEYWGRYVAFFESIDGRSRLVLRDPTGGMPCLHVHTKDAHVFASDAEALSMLSLPAPSINWSHVSAFLSQGRLVARDCGLSEITQIFAGECVELRPHRWRKEFLWDPATVIARGAIDDQPEAVRQLRRAITSSVGAWSSCYKNLMLELSGGLDSSVVLSSLVNAPSPLNVLCINTYTESPGGDERVYAREAARHAGVDLLEAPLRSADRDLKSMLDPKKFASPAWSGLIAEADLIRMRIAKNRGVEAIFSGQGGDQLFHRRKSHLIPAEYVWRHGLRAPLFKVIADTSRLMQQSFWDVLVATAKHRLFHVSVDPYASTKSSPLLSDGAHALAKEIDRRHPWLKNDRPLPCAKRQQIFDVIDLQNFSARSSPHADIVHPLVSQPIIEVCLQIPSYILTYSGLDRALVRDAFSRDLPRAVVQRMTKGGTTGYFNRVMIDNREFLREFLLDGSLVKQEILDKAKIEVELSEGRLLQGKALVPILLAVRAENWLRSWTYSDNRAAA